jgi:hypothetical protein
MADGHVEKSLGRDGSNSGESREKAKKEMDHE